MARFIPADAETNGIIHEVREKSHPDLAKCSLACVLATHDRPIPAAIVKPSSPAQRAAGLADGILVIDATRWGDTSAAGRVAIVAHGLASVAVVYRGDRPALDASGRPRIRRRPFDIEGVGYADVLKRHKSRSVEHAALLAIRDKTAGLGPDDGPSLAIQPSKPTPKPKPSSNPRPRPAA